MSTPCSRWKGFSTKGNHDLDELAGEQQVVPGDALDDGVLRDAVLQADLDSGGGPCVALDDGVDAGLLGFGEQLVAERILAATSRKKPHPLYASASFGHWNDGLCVQMLHVGPYDDEPVSFNMMQAYCAEHGLRRASDSHREIYLSDARKTDPARLKTVLRFGVVRSPQSTAFRS